MPVAKSELKNELLALLQARLDLARAAHAAAVAGATDDEARPENDKDTRGLEQSYLARGQAQRVGELDVAIAEVAALELREFQPGDAIAAGALVTVDEDGEDQTFFLARHGGGSTLAGDTQVVTPASPLGRALLGKRIDDEVEVSLPGRVRRFVISAVR